MSKITEKIKCLFNILTGYRGRQEQREKKHNIAQEKEKEQEKSQVRKHKRR